MTKLLRGDQIGRLAVVFWPILLVSNVTESMFFQAGSVWFSMLLVTMDNPRQRDVGVRMAHRQRHQRNGARAAIRAWQPTKTI